MFFCLKGNYFAETFAELFPPRGEDKVSIHVNNQSGTSAEQTILSGGFQGTDRTARQPLGLFFNSVTDPEPGSGVFLTPGSGMGKKVRIRISDEQPGSYF